MSIVAIYLLKPKSKKSKVYIQKKVVVTVKTSKFLIEKGLYQYLEDSKKTKILSVDMEDEIIKMEYNILELDEFRTKLLAFIKNLIFNQLKKFNENMSDNELSFFNRLLYDLYNIYYILIDNLSYQIISMSEGEILN